MVVGRLMDSSIDRNVWTDLPVLTDYHGAAWYIDFDELDI